MHRTRSRRRLGALALAVALATSALAVPAAAAPGTADAATATVADTSATDDRPPARPRNDVIEDVEEDPDDASLLYELLPYHAFPQALRDLQESDRVSVEILGESVQGRDLHLVVVTDMDDDEWDEWQRLSDLRTDDPAAAIAAFEAGEYDDWRLPVFINNTIHGNEWEGSDYFLEYVEELAFSDAPEVLETLESQLVVGILSQNPDGRVLGTRANANGYDLNRDYVAQTQPETLIARDQIIRYNPVSLLDTHGYVANTLILPSTGPHGPNYEIDLYLKHSFGAALAMEEEVLALNEPRAIHPSGRIRIPYRDNADGWGPYPPIYTPMYAMQHGGHGHTIEVPLNPRGNLSQEERLERVRINMAVGLATLEGNERYLLEERDEVLADQLEFYRRGVAGEPGREITDPFLLEQAACGSFVNQFDDDRVVEHCNSDVYVNEYPRVWVLPIGDGQRSDTAAITTARYLLDNDVEVLRADTEVTVEGETYGPGTFVVDMRQAKRNVAQNVFEVGRNLSDEWRTTYADDAFSPAALYGPTYTDVWDEDLSLDGLTPVDDAVTPGTVPDGAAHLGFEVVSAEDVQAVNHLLEAGVELTRLSDGTVVVPGDAVAEAEQVAATFGLDLTALDDLDVRGAAPLATRTVGFRGSVTQRDALLDLGFELVPITHQQVNSGEVSFDDLDALFVAATGFTPGNLTSDAAAAFDAWLADGHPVVLQGQNGANFSQQADLLPLTVANAGSGDGIVGVLNDPDSQVTGDALDLTYVNAPRWVTNADDVDGLQVDQRTEPAPDHFLAGHWRRYREGADRAVVVSGEARGTQVTWFGTDPTFRAHTRGLFPQVAEGLWPVWPAAPAPSVEDLALETRRNAVVRGQLDVTPAVAGEDVAVSFGTPARGTVRHLGDGSFTYRPDVGFVGTDTFTVTVTDIVGVTDQATVTVTVTHPRDLAPTAGTPR